jgi:hypothetical protein
LGETKLTASMCLNPASIRGAGNGFSVGGNLPAEALPRVAWAFDQCDGVANHGIAGLSKKFLCAVEETFAHWSVFLAAKRGELLELAALLWIQARGHLHDQPRE